MSPDINIIKISHIEKGIDPKGSNKAPLPRTNNLPSINTSSPAYMAIVVSIAITEGTKILIIPFFP